MIIRPPTSALRLRALAAATGLVLASTLLVPGAALAANGPPHPEHRHHHHQRGHAGVRQRPRQRHERRAGPAHRHGATGRSARPSARITIDADGNYVFTPGRELERDDVDDLRRRQQQAHPHRHDQHHRARGQRRPTANDDTVTATEDTATNVTAGLLANDTDPDGDTLAVTAATNATGGTVGLLGRRRHVHPDRRRVRRG